MSFASGPLSDIPSDSGRANENLPVLELDGLHKRYGAVHALRGINLAVRDGEFVTLLGPSGSGKTTLLMLLAGFEQPTEGRISARGVDVTRLPPERRGFGVVFQNYALFPHMSVGSNVAYPLEVRRVNRNERRRRVEEALELVDLPGLEDRRPSQLSGGQQQRVALARALVYRPSVLLLDEPLGALDRALRERMQSELRQLHHRVGVTFLYVTHDQDEALTMSDRVVVFRHGQIDQVGTPQEIYSRPATTFVASFVGAANLVPCQIASVDGPSARVVLPDGSGYTVACPTGTRAPGDGRLLLRPEKARISAAPPTESDLVAFRGVLREQVFAGSWWRHEVDSVAGLQAYADRPAGAPGETVTVAWEKEDVWALGVAE